MKMVLHSRNEWKRVKLCRTPFIICSCPVSLRIFSCQNRFILGHDSPIKIRFLRLFLKLEQLIFLQFLN